MKHPDKITPSEFYKMNRPEYFSDSELVDEIILTREQFAFELNQITTNQKHDEFENFCRKLAEKTIAPNLIPQVGPTGGGDGKTDSETYPVAQSISDRWFIPENGWDKDQKWAFAISAKEQWKGKAKRDIKNIVETQREYNHIFFMTNRTPSSKKKKDAQDEFKKEFGIEITILDGVWVLEKIFSNDLIDLAVETLNLSKVFIRKKSIVGSNDATRIKKLKEIEENIQNPKRYFEYDYQLVEDALEAAILSRMLEKPRDEVEGKFDRAFRLCRKTNNQKQWVRLHYQRAWTYIHWYDDYDLFIEEFKKFKPYISEKSTIFELELYFNFINLLRGISTTGNCDLSQYEISFKNERNLFHEIIQKFTNDNNKPCSTLTAKSYVSIQKLADTFYQSQNPNKFLIELSDYVSKSENYIDYPFESIKEMIELFGHALPNNSEYDNLIDCLVEISAKRTSDINSAKILLKRASQKLSAEYYKDSIVFFGKTVVKLAKEESQDGMYLSLRGLAQAYSSLGLIWAANNCLIAAISLSFKSWYEKGFINKRTYYCAKELSKNELLLGRIPSFLSWHELFKILSKQLKINEEEKEIPSAELLDACLAVRILNSKNDDNLIVSLPDILEEQELWISQNSCFYKLGYIDLILNDYKGINIHNSKELDTHFNIIACQPFKDQMIYESNYLAEENIKLYSNILGCQFIIKTSNKTDLLLAGESLLAFFESFFATSLKNIFPNKESIIIEILENPEIESLSFSTTNSSSEYKVEISSISFSHETRTSTVDATMSFLTHLLSNNFLFDEFENHLENLFKKEEIIERFSICFEHTNFTYSTLGASPKLFFSDWIKKDKLKTYPMQREKALVFEQNKTSTFPSPTKNLNNLRHDNRKVVTVVDVNLWNIAGWQVFGFAIYEDHMGLFIGFEDGEIGKKIFDDWVNRFGKEDKDELINITIIRGIDKLNPFAYRVHITAKINKETFSQTDEILITSSKTHDLVPTSSENLEKLIASYKSLGQYWLWPAEAKENRNPKHYYDKAILKKELSIINAWEIGLTDLNNIAIKPTDNPVIPNHITNAPILKVLERYKNK